MKDKIMQINKKVALGFLTAIFMVAVITVSSFIPFIIDPSRFLTKKFLTDEIIIVAITIVATVIFMFISMASNADNEGSELCKARVVFKKSMENITDKEKFFQWVKKKLRVQDKEEMIEQEMDALGLDKRIFYLADTEIKALTVAQKYDDVFYKPLTNNQIKEVLKVKKKINHFKYVNPSYYTTVKNIGAHKTNSQKASSEGAKKIAYVLWSLTTKIILTLIIAMVWASLVKDLSGAEQSKSEAWMTFLSRMFAFVSSSFLGWVVGSKLNDIDAFYILNRVEAHERYLNDKEFIKVDEGKEAYIERVAQEQILLDYK